LARAPPWQNRDKTPSVGHLCVKTRPALVRLETQDQLHKTRDKVHSLGNAEAIFKERVKNGDPFPVLQSTQT